VFFLAAAAVLTLGSCRPVAQEEERGAAFAMTGEHLGGKQRFLNAVTESMCFDPGGS
jgi:hypothetical protein